MRTRRKFWIFNQTWYSICSRHHDFNEDCNTCQIGKWVYDIIFAIDSFIYKRWYGLWYWWHNLPRNKRWLEKIFPGLKNN